MHTLTHARMHACMHANIQTHTNTHKQGVQDSQVSSLWIALIISSLWKLLFLNFIKYPVKAVVKFLFFESTVCIFIVEFTYSYGYMNIFIVVPTIKCVLLIEVMKLSLLGLISFLACKHE